MSTLDTKRVLTLTLSAFAVVAMLGAFPATSPARADDDEHEEDGGRGGRGGGESESESDEEGSEGGGAASVSIPEALPHDVQVRVALTGGGSADKRRGRGRGRGRGRDGAAAAAVGSANVVVSNNGTTAETGVALEIHAGASIDGTPLWTGTIDLAPGESATVGADISLPAGTTRVTAVARLAGDERPTDNRYTVPAKPDATPADPWMGLSVWETNGCGGCHGISGGGGTAPAIRRESAGEIREVTAEGEDEMPSYPEFSSADARDVAAFLADASNTIATRPAPVTGTGGTGGGTGTGGTGGGSGGGTGGGAGGGTGGTQTPTWSGQIQGIFSSNCAGCHQGTSAPKGVKLNTYANVKANASRSLTSIRNGSMPPAGPMAKADIDAIAAWIAGGMPQ